MHVITGALHNSAERSDSPKCHENTRVAVIEEIIDWVTDSYRQTRVLWMYGPAGAGKSAIARTIAEMCSIARILAASFFCAHSISGRNEKTFVITTIVSQLIVAIPEMREHVGNALHKDQSLLSRSLEAQLEGLIVEPLEVARLQAGPSDIDFLQSLPKLIILDGLDECEDHSYVLQVILAAVNRHNLPFSFLITSRPEQKIREAFDESTMVLITMRLVLDNKYLPDEDIRSFLMSRFRDIKQRHPSRTSLPTWPSEHEIERLVQKSSGQFIYVSTVIKFIDSHRHWPPDRLNIIFGILPRGKTTPFAEMDALYSLILTAASDNVEKILDIFTTLLFLRTSHTDWKRTVPFLESFLSYRTGEIFMILSDLHSIISVPFEDQQDMALEFFHASLEDFLTDLSRCGDAFFLDPGISHRKIATWMMKKITGPSSSIFDFPILILSNRYLTGHLAVEFIDHCLKSTPTQEFLSNLGRFDMSHVLYTEIPVAENLMRIFHAVNSDSQIPKFLVWLHQQVSPELTFCNNGILIHVRPSAANNGKRTIAFTFTCGVWTYGLADS